LPSETRRGRDALAPCACVTPGANSSMKSNGMADESPAGWRGASRRCVFPACPGVPSLVQGIRMPHSLQGGFLSPCIPSLVLGFRTPKLPLLPLWEKGVGGMRGQTRPEYNQTINPRCLATACALSFEPGAEFDPPAAMLPLPTLAYTPVRGCCLAAHWDSE
jgi:hypothetical protein